MVPWYQGPMQTIAVLNQKGGVGKTTLATNLAAAAHLEARRTLLVDHDAQGSALDWSLARGERSKLDGLTVVKSDRALQLPRFREMSRGYDAVVLDAPPRLGDITRSIAMAADVVLIPVQASAFDFWAIEETVKLLDSADELRAQLGWPPARRAFVVNRAIARTELAREAGTAIEGEVAGTLHQRIAFPKAAEHGESVLTLAPDGAAAHEVRRLWRAVRGAA